MASSNDPLPSTRDRAPERSAFAGKIVNVEVGTGDNKRTFYAHHELLTFYSGYFKAALNGSFAEAQSGVIELDSEDPVVFQEFVMWLYTNKTRTDVITAANCASHFASCVKLWIFADRRNIPLLMNEMVDRFHESVVCAWHLPSRTIKEVYENTTEGSALRRLLVDIFSRIAGKSSAHEYWRDESHDFLRDVVASLLSTDLRKRMEPKEYKQVAMCPSFHVHEEGVCCKRTAR